MWNPSCFPRVPMSPWYWCYLMVPFNIKKTQLLCYTLLTTLPWYIWRPIKQSEYARQPGHPWIKGLGEKQVKLTRGCVCSLTDLTRACNVNRDQTIHSCTKHQSWGLIAVVHLRCPNHGSLCTLTDVINMRDPYSARSSAPLSHVPHVVCKE